MCPEMELTFICRDSLIISEGNRLPFMDISCVSLYLSPCDCNEMGLVSIIFIHNIAFVNMKVVLCLKILGDCFLFTMSYCGITNLNHSVLDLLSDSLE